MNIQTPQPSAYAPAKADPASLRQARPKLSCWRTHRRHRNLVLNRVQSPGADCLVVVTKRADAGGTKGASHRGSTSVGSNWQ